GIVHRDLKPSNLFLADLANGERQVKVLDFGISKILYGASDDLTNTEAMLGTPKYMAPEQLRDAKTADGRSDVWSLGVVVYELLTGQTPFARASMAETVRAILDEDVGPASALRRDVPTVLDAALLPCFVRDPAKRVPDVATLALSLARFGGPRA